MTLASCLVKAVDEAIRLNNYFPLITYKVATPISIALNAYMITYAPNSRDILIVALVSEIIGLSLVVFLTYCQYSYFKSHLIAYAQGLGAWRFPLKLADTIGVNGKVAGFAINAIRGAIALQGIDSVYFRTRFRHLNERDVVLLVGSLSLLLFSVWAGAFQIMIQEQFKPAYDICYR